MATATARNARNPDSEDCITHVQCDGLAAMKIIKHCHEEATSNIDVVQGALLGLVVDKCLEITNCFPFSTSDESIDDEEYQLTMMRRLRRVNVDHFHVGWYQSADVGNFLSTAFVDSQFHYQTSIQESVVLIYDTQKSARGFLAIKAYRLTPQAIEMYQDNDFTPDALRKLKMSYENLLTEVPIVIKNSLLSNIMMMELTEMVPEEDGNHFLDLGTASVLETDLRVLMGRVDELYQESTKFFKHLQLVNRQEVEKHRAMSKHQQENAARVARGEEPLADDEVNKLFRPLSVPPRLVPMITSGQINTYSQHISQFCSQSLAKLYMTQALQAAKETKQQQ